MPLHTSTPTWKAGDNCYILDPEVPGQVYRAKILNADRELVIGLYPDPNAEPIWDTISSHYVVEGVKAADLLRLPPPQGQVMGYAQVLQATGDDSSWQPAPDQPQQQAPATTTGLFTGVETGQQQPAQQPVTAAQRSPAPAHAGPDQAPAPAQAQAQAGSDQAPVPASHVFAPGDKVRVKEDPNHPFWGPLAGKEGYVTAAEEPMDEGTQFITMMIEGLTYADVQAYRVELVGHDQVEGRLHRVEAGSLQAKAHEMVGTKVHVTHARLESAYRGMLNRVDEEGLHIEGFGAPVTWSSVKDIAPMGDHPVPGDPKDKARVEKNNQDEAATPESLMAEIDAILTEEKVATKETIGKRAYRKLMDRWNLLKQKGAPAGGGPTSTSTTSAGTREEGYVEALNDMRSALDQMAQY